MNPHGASGMRGHWYIGDIVARLSSRRRKKPPQVTVICPERVTATEKSWSEQSGGRAIEPSVSRSPVAGSNVASEYGADPGHGPLGLVTR
jgi:hypothetical protein